MQDDSRFALVCGYTLRQPCGDQHALPEAGRHIPIGRASNFQLSGFDTSAAGYSGSRSVRRNAPRGPGESVVRRIDSPPRGGIDLADAASLMRPTVRSMFALLLLVACGEGASLDDGATAPMFDGKGDDAQAGAACFVADAATLPKVAAGTHAAGDFRVQIAATGRLDIRHVADPGRSLFASPSGPPLRAARATVNVTDHQGSFHIDETVDAACNAPALDEVRSGGGVVALRGRFTDAASACAALRWELQLCQAQAGHLAFRLVTNDPSFDALTLRVASDAAEKIFGLGEQLPHDRLDLKGRAIPVISQEGGVGRGHTPITQAVNVASPGSGGSQDSTYYAAPHYLTTRLRSLFLENTEVAIFDFTASDVTEVKLYAPAMVGRVLFGQSPLQLVERFTDWAGRMPAPPDWGNRGAIVALARDVGQSRGYVNDLRAHGAAIAGVWNQTWSGKVTTYIGEQVLWNWVQNATYHPDWQGFVSGLEQDGIRTLCYLNPMIVNPPANAGPVARNLYQEALNAGYFVKKADGTPYLIKVTAFDVGLLDLTNPGARQWMKAVIQDEVMTNARCSGWMVDFAEALPFDAVLFSGVSAATYHNRYPVEWMRLNREAIEEAGRLGDVITFNRAGSARTPAYSLLLWEGDQLTTWDKYDGLVSALHGLLNGGFSGIALNHSDTGGYTSLSVNGVGYDREQELLQRWTEMNAFTAVLRTHEGNQPALDAQVYSNTATLDHFARFTRVYRALAFYRAQLFAEATQKGWPVVRHLWLQFPDDAVAATIDDQFMLGSEILVAPVKNKCWTWPVCPYDKETYLPKGQWVHLWSGKVYGSLTGGTKVTVKAPIGQPAVFYRKGSTVGAQLVANLKAEGIAVANAP
jgi:alpha-glucosidase